MVRKVEVNQSFKKIYTLLRYTFTETEKKHFTGLQDGRAKNDLQAWRPLLCKYCLKSTILSFTA